jgi:gas vesicle protein
MNPETPDTPSRTPTQPIGVASQAQNPHSGMLPPSPVINNTPPNTPMPQPPSDNPTPSPRADMRALYSPNYLEEIAVQPPAKAPNKLIVIGIIVGVLLAAAFAFLLISTSGSPSVANQMTTINKRIDTLQSVAANQQKHLTENAIAEANATLSSSLTTMSADLSALNDVKENNDKPTTKPETTYQTNLADTLDAAYQRGTLDRTYTVQMTYELTILRNMLVTLKTNSSQNTIKKFCDTSITNLDSILKLYANFDATKS